VWLVWHCGMVGRHSTFEHPEKDHKCYAKE
jgi:hypothetical protein